MCRVFITGDVHCPIDIHKLNSKNFPTGKGLTKDDIVMICGDGGFVWSGDNRDKYWIEWLNRKPWTTVYVDGNHENFDLLKQYSVVDFHGAKAHKISDSLYHILRGEIMDINEEKYFCFGGAFSHDREYRTENIDWWQAELPVQEEIDNAIINLKKHNNKVDYVISHDVPTSINIELGYHIPNIDNYDKGKHIHICNFFQNIVDTVEYKVWFAGHYHTDRKINKVQILYEDIVEIKETKKEVFGHKLENEYEYYEIVKGGIKDILNRKFSKAKLKRLCKDEKLYMDNRKMDTYDNFNLGETIIPVTQFFDVDVTNVELEALTYMYNDYTIRKNTQNE